MAEVERRLGLLSDERMVLKAFDDWPEKKIEALREATVRKHELQRLAATMDPTTGSWVAKGSIGDELQQVAAKFDEGKAKIEWYLRSQEDFGRALAALAIPFDRELVTTAQHATLKLAKYGMRMVLTATKRLAAAASGGGAGEGEGEAASAASYGAVERLVMEVLELAFRVHQFVGGFDTEATQLFSDVHAALASLQHHHQD